ncbi:MAG: ROK family protein [Acidobacteriaceae bacterium]|nr:ROK family protein [Acidobacteriaceae bacterium]
MPVIAEGRIDTPDLARAALRAGAFAIVVGSAITRPHIITRQFAEALADEFARANGRLLILGIDLGGTNTKSGLASSAGKLLWDETVSTPAAAGRTALLTHLVKIAERGLDRAHKAGHQPGAIGVATAGWVDPRTGRVVYATENLPGWTGTAIADEISARTGLPVYVENDANALAVGEAEFGAGRGLTDFVCITVGTGVGSGCYLGGRLNRGAHFFANALGHIVIHPGGPACNCGQQGCLETYTNATALLSYGEGRYSSTKDLIAAAHLGEAVALAAITETARHLAIGCNVLVQLLDPQAIILSGGLAQNNPYLLVDLEANLSKLVTVWNERRLRVTASSLGYHGGVLGAAGVALARRQPSF